jgi:3-methylcrotonyl-CoA carboxylase alpha subunit
VDTGLIGRDQDALTTLPPPSPQAHATAAMAALGLTNGKRGHGFTLWQPLTHSVTLTHDDTPHTARVTIHPDGVDVNDVSRAKHLDHAVAEDRITVFEGATPHVFTRIDPLTAAADATGGDSITAPMPGLVKLVMTEEGAQVTKGDALMVLEAMKMEHTLTAPRDGTVATLGAAPGSQVSDGDILLTLEPEET